MLAFLVAAIAAPIVDRVGRRIVLHRPGLGGRCRIGFATLRPIANPSPRVWRGARVRWLLGAWVLAAVAALVALGLGWLAHPGAQVGLGAALGGAATNLHDRVRGRVVDYLDLGVGGVFNIADLAIVGGAIATAVLGVVPLFARGVAEVLARTG